jgi:hypothetical protein
MIQIILNLNYRRTKQVSALIGIGLALFIIGILSALYPNSSIAIMATSILVLITLGLLTRPIWICYLVVFFTPLISGMPRGGFIPLFRPNEPLLIGLFGILIIRKLFNAKEGIKIRITPVDRSFVVLLVGGTIIPMIAYIARQGKINLDGIFIYISVIQYYLVYRIVIETVKSKEEVINVIKLALVAGIIVSLVGLLEALRIPLVESYLLAFYPSAHLLKTLEINRIVSILGNWHALAAFTLMQLTIVAIYLFRGDGIIKRKLLLLSGASNLVSMVPIVSLAGVAGFGAMAVSFILWVRSSWKAILLSGIILIFALSLFWPYVQERIEFQFGDSDGLLPRTGIGRLNKWSTVFWPVIKDNLVFGFGPLIPEEFAWHFFESQYIAVLFKGGLIYLFTHIYFVIFIAYYLYHKFRTDYTVAGLNALCALIFLIIISVMGFANEYFTYSGVMEVFWIFLGLATIQAR